MNAVEESKNDLKAGNYVRKAKPDNNYWFSFYANKMRRLNTKFGKDFFLIIHGSEDIEDDYFVIPYADVEHLLTDTNLTKIDGDAKDAKTRTPRWSGNLVDNRFHISNSGERIDVSKYYGDRLLLRRAMDPANHRETADLPQFNAAIADPAPYDPECLSGIKARRQSRLGSGLTGSSRM
jgi:hypothetical protein